MTEQIIPAVLREVMRGTFTPLDGRQLTSLLHGAGVNCRYLGRLASDAGEDGILSMCGLAMVFLEGDLGRIGTLSCCLTSRGVVKEWKVYLPRVFWL